MDRATEKPQDSVLPALLAGLQTGMLGVCFMLAWLGISAEWQRRSFWTAENLMASVFYGSESVHSGFAGRTLSGLAVYLLLYSALGAIFVLIVHRRLPARRALLASVLFAIAWYYVAFRWIFQGVLPLVALLHAERPTMIGHLIYGTFLSRYPVYLRAHRQEEAPEAAPAPESNGAAPPEASLDHPADAATETPDGPAAQASTEPPHSEIPES
jgi:hypothetical protein